MLHKVQARGTYIHRVEDNGYIFSYHYPVN